MQSLNWLVSFNLGLVSSIHCFGMCGGIMTAMTLSTPGEITGNRVRLFGMTLMFNLGRIASYTLAGLLVGFLGGQLLELTVEFQGHTYMRVLAGIILLLIGLNIMGLFPQLREIERLGRYLWSFIQPLTQRLLPLDTPLKGFAAGAVWGWLPCGLVYAVLLWNFANADPIDAGMNLFMFGLGTLPMLMFIGFMSGSFRKLASHKGLRVVLGLMVIAFGIYTALPMDHDQSSHNQHHHAGHLH